MSSVIKLDVINNNDLQLMGIEALQKELGVVGMLRFMEQFDGGGLGDYTSEKYLEEDVDMTRDELLRKYC